MRTIPIFTKDGDQVVSIPDDLKFNKLEELEICRKGDLLILRPIRQDWLSLAEQEKADNDFLVERSDVISDEGCS